jgi:hypothetical protein
LLRIGVLALNRTLTLEGIIPKQMAILIIGAIRTRTDQIKIVNIIRVVIPLTLKIIDLADLIIDKDSQIKITTPLGEIGISKIITPKTECFTYKKVDHRVLLWIETRCHKSIITDYHLLDPTTDKQTQEEIGVDKTTLILKTQGFTYKRIGHMTILLREIRGEEKKTVYLNLLHLHTHKLIIVWEERI